MWRRMILIPFNRIFSDKERDYDLSDKLKKEYPGSEVDVDGLQKYNEIGLNKPEKILNAVSEYRNEMDTVHRFVEEKCTLDGTSRTPLKDLKGEYLAWCNEEQLPNLPVSDFKKSLLDIGVKEKKVDSKRFYEGIKLNEAFTSLPNEDYF